jgi:hypothetical protein
MSTSLVLWLNGPFGAGKTSVAHSLIGLHAEAVLYDPEPLGVSLLEAEPTADDFQDLPRWRELVVAGAARLAHEGSALLIMPISVLSLDHVGELRAGLEGEGLVVRHLLLDVSENELQRRIAGDGSESQEAARWRRRQLPCFLAARQRLCAEADLVVATDGVSVASVSATIARTGILDQMGDREDSAGPA